MACERRKAAVTWIALAAAAALTGACTVTNQSIPTPPSPQQPGTAGTTVQVGIPSNAAQLGTAAYGANPLSISAGITVTWTNLDSMAHTVTADDGSFDSGPIAPGSTYSRTFNAPATIPYHCSIHGQAAMSGVLVVGSGS